MSQHVPGRSRYFKVTLGLPGTGKRDQITKRGFGPRVWVHTSAFKVNADGHTAYQGTRRSEAEKPGRLPSSACGFPVAVTAVIVVIADCPYVKGVPPLTPVAPAPVMGTFT